MGSRRAALMAGRNPAKIPTDPLKATAMACASQVMMGVLPVGARKAKRSTINNEAASPAIAPIRDKTMLSTMI